MTGAAHEDPAARAKTLGVRLREVATLEKRLALLDPGTPVLDFEGGMWLRHRRFASFELLRPDGTPTGLLESPRHLLVNLGPLTVQGETVALSDEEAVS